MLVARKWLRFVTVGSIGVVLLVMGFCARADEVSSVTARLLETRDGIPLVRSISYFEPVTLRSGEAAQIKAYRSLKGELIPDGALETKVMIGFAIGNDEAERFGLWQGELFSDPVELHKPPKRRWWQR